LVAGPVKWAERWIARAQRKADLRAERFLRHEEGARAGTEPPSLLDRMESRNTLFLNASKPGACLNGLTLTSAASTVIGRWLPGRTRPRWVLLTHGAPGWWTGTRRPG